MVLVPLTNVQLEELADLTSSRRIQLVFADLDKARRFIARAQAAVESGGLPHPDLSFNLAYDACHDVGEGLLAA